MRNTVLKKSVSALKSLMFMVLVACLLLGMTYKVVPTDASAKKKAKSSKIKVTKTKIEADEVLSTGEYASVINYKGQDEGFDEEEKNFCFRDAYLVNSKGKIIIKSVKASEGDSTYNGKTYADGATMEFSVQDNGLILCDGLGYYTAKGKEAIKYKWWKKANFVIWTTDFSDGVAVVCLSKDLNEFRYYLTDKKGKKLAEIPSSGECVIDKTKFTYEDAWLCAPQEGIARLVLEHYNAENDTYSYEIPGFYNSKGKFVRLTDTDGKYYDDVWGSQEGLCAVKDVDTQLLGFVDKKGKLIIPCEYSYITNDGFRYGVCAMGKNIGGKIKYGVIDKTGETVVPFEYEFCCAIAADKFLAYKDGLYGVINKKNKTVIPFKYNISSFEKNESLIMFEIDGKCGLLDYSGKTVLPFEYDEIIDFSKDNLVIACKDGKYGAVDYKGKVIIPFEYDDISQATDKGVIYAIKNRKLCIIKGAVK